jgi:hypothetical protein
MPRRARISVPNVPWHIVQRGNNRSPRFFHPEDYRKYLDTLGQQAAVSTCAVHDLLGGDQFKAAIQHMLNRRATRGRSGRPPKPRDRR